ncbi:hypothetical protein DCAR_0831636 [Daucus carota subsp. sativus]|uniref:DUF4219 domain-containing protein n=1 Tax=Daucus carota subsp. sativus TaxID=79200 RepID=A0AAF0XRT8_DAUCS|nr:hypothetical protein DCAR_0831636 [Daucus carota subsp. sativus]
MADSSGNISHAMIPQFSGESYDFWSIKMKTLFKSMELWDLVEKGFSDRDNDANRLRENKKKEAKALFFIQQAMHETIFSRIASATKAKEAWDILKTEFQGSAKVIEVKIQILSRDFETLLMKDGESVQEFLSRVSGIVSQMRALGETIPDKKIVCKVLRSLPQKFDSVVSAIE